MAGEHTTVAIAEGLTMPLLGLGVWQAAEGAQTSRAVGGALEAGYRHIDTAQAYGNERSVGEALRASGVPREHVFLTTKFRPGLRDPERELEASLQRLGVDQVDLYLVHWPQGGPTRAWAGMERSARHGLTKAIGVSNFAVEELEALLAVAAIAPPSTRCSSAPSSSVAHCWAIQRDIPAIPKSVHRERIIENAQVFDFTLHDDDLGTLDALDRTGGTGRARERPWW